MFKRKIKRSDRMQGLLDCENDIKDGVTYDCIVDEMNMDSEIDILFPEHSLSYRYYYGKLDYLKYHRGVLVNASQ